MWDLSKLISPTFMYKLGSCVYAIRMVDKAKNNTAGKDIIIIANSDLAFMYLFPAI